MKEINWRRGIIPAVVQIVTFLLMQMGLALVFSLITALFSLNWRVQVFLIHYERQIIVTFTLLSLCAAGALTAIILRKLGHGAFLPTPDSNKLISLVLVPLGLLTLLFLGSSYLRVIAVIAGIFFWFWAPNRA